MDLPFAQRHAMPCYRTTATARFARSTNKRAKFHEGLVQFAAGIRARRFRHHFLSEPPKFCIYWFGVRVAPDSEQPSQYSNDITIENRCRLVEGDAANRAGGVAANSWQRQH